MKIENLALNLFNIGAVELEKRKTKIHEKYSESVIPFFPIFFSLRKPPKGKLSEYLIQEIGVCLFYIAQLHNLKFDYVIGVPYAGEVLADAFAKASSYTISVLKLQKEETSKRRKILPIISGDFKKGKMVLIIDDVVTGADTKIEAITAIKNNGLKVNDCLVFINREMGGLTVLSHMGVSLYFYCTSTELVNIYVKQGLISTIKQQEIFAHQQLVKELVTKNF